MELLENELNRGPFKQIVECTKNILLKVSRGNHIIPVQVQNAAVVSLGKYFFRIEIGFNWTN